jgi:hypothetical protein
VARKDRSPESRGGAVTGWTKSRPRAIENRGFQMKRGLERAVALVRYATAKRDLAVTMASRTWLHRTCPAKDNAVASGFFLSLGSIRLIRYPYS